MGKYMWQVRVDILKEIDGALGKTQEQLKSSYPILIDHQKHWQKWIVMENFYMPYAFYLNLKHINGCYFIKPWILVPDLVFWLLLHVKFLM